MSDYNDGILLRPCLRMDTHFGDEYESVEFGDGTGYIKAAPILAKVGALHEEIDGLRDESAELREERDMYRDLVGCMVHPDIPDQLQAENEQLRKERDFYFQQVTDNGERAHGAIDALQAENANLRELVRHMHTCLEHYEPGDTISCKQCPYDNETWGCDYERLMEKLGIGVEV